jgi:hypothetical protein
MHFQLFFFFLKQEINHQIILIHIAVIKISWKKHKNATLFFSVECDVLRPFKKIKYLHGNIDVINEKLVDKKLSVVNQSISSH